MALARAHEVVEVVVDKVALVEEEVVVQREIHRGCILVKRDLAEASRHIPVAESDWWLLGFSWDGNYYMERYLPFGL